MGAKEVLHRFFVFIDFARLLFLNFILYFSFFTILYFSFFTFQRSLLFFRIHVAILFLCETHSVVCFLFCVCEFIKLTHEFDMRIAVDLGKVFNHLIL